MLDSAGLQQRRASFRALHQQGCFVIPNPWDAGSAKALASMGFRALASTSSGLAWSCGMADGQMSRDQVLAHMRMLVQATALPVNADFESGFGQTAEDVLQSVRMAVDTGVAGISIEDASGDPAQPLRSIADSVERLRAARAAIDTSGADVLLVGRAENFFVGCPDIDDTVARIRAYAEVGADCLYAPGISTSAQIQAVVAAAAGKPVNLLLGAAQGLSVDDVAALGVRRISVGGALARAAWAGFLQAAQGIATHGRFDGLAAGTPAAELNTLLRS